MKLPSWDSNEMYKIQDASISIGAVCRRSDECANKKAEEYRMPAKSNADTITPPQRGCNGDGLCGTHCTEMTVLDVLITRIDAKLVKSERHTHAHTSSKA